MHCFTQLGSEIHFDEIKRFLECSFLTPNECEKKTIYINSREPAVNI